MDSVDNIQIIFDKQFINDISESFFIIFKEEEYDDDNIKQLKKYENVYNIE